MINLDKINMEIKETIELIKEQQAIIDEVLDIMINEEVAPQYDYLHSTLNKAIDKKDKYESLYFECLDKKKEIEEGYDYE